MLAAVPHSRQQQVVAVHSHLGRRRVGGAKDFADCLKSDSKVVADVPGMQQLDCTEADESSFCIIMMHLGGVRGAWC